MTVLQIQTPRIYLPLLKPARYKGAHGGRGCCHPDTPIDTPSGQVKISEFRGGEVFSYLNGKIVVAQATPAISYTEEDIFSVRLDCGVVIRVTDQHRFLTGRGWVECRDLVLGDECVYANRLDEICLHHSISGLCPLGSPLDDRRCIGTPEDCRASCSLYSHQCGQQPQLEAGSVPSKLQQQDGEQQRNSRTSILAGALEFLSRHILSPLSIPPSIHGALLAMVGKCFAGKGSCSDEKISGQLLESCQCVERSPLKGARSQQAEKFCSPQEDSCIRKSQDESCEMHLGMQPHSALYGSLFDDSCIHDRPSLSKVVEIRNIGRHIYWDLHVPILENYLSDGVVNHNSGKSHFFGEMLIERSIMDKVDAVCVREIQQSLDQSVKKLLEGKIEALNAGAYFEVQDKRIHSKNGGVIIFQGMRNHTADSIKSLEGYDIAWVEEAQSVSQKSLDMLRPTIRKPGSELWFSWNPSKETDPVDVLLRGESPPPDSVVVEANYMDNPWLPKELLEEMEYDKRRDPDKYAHIWLGKYQRSSETRVFKNWRVEEFEVDPTWTIRQGADWGFSVDPSVLVQCAIVGRTLYVPYEAYRVGCEITDTPELFMSLPDAEKWPMTADSARPETISHMRKNGFPKIVPAIKGARSLEEGVEWLKSFDIVVHPRCKHLIDELTLYSYKTDPLTQLVLPALEDKDNHVIDALRYACEGARRAQAQKPVVVRQPMPIVNNWGRR